MRASARPDVASRELSPSTRRRSSRSGGSPCTPPEELAEIVGRGASGPGGVRAEPLEARSRLLERVVHALVEAPTRSPARSRASRGKPLAEAYAHGLVVAGRRVPLARRKPRARPRRRSGSAFPSSCFAQKRGCDPLRARRRRRDRHALELPARDPVRRRRRRSRPGTRRPQAVRADAAHRRVGRGGVPAAGAPRRPRPGRAGREATSARRSSGTAGRAVVFTGSAEVGREVARRRRSGSARSCSSSAARTRCSSSTTPTSTARSRARSGASFTNCGQACAGSSASTSLGALHDAFVERLAGRPRLRSAAAGPGGRARAAVSEGSARGSRPRRGRGRARRAVAAGGGRPPSSRVVLRADDARRRAADARLASEEIFGPASRSSRSTTRTRRCGWANDSPFGLGASVWTRDAAGPVRSRARIEAGMRLGQRPRVLVRRLPGAVGRRKGSGSGGPARRHGLYALSHVKSWTPTAAG